MRRLISGHLLCMALALAATAGAADLAEDHRAWQHGIDLVRVGDKLLAVWGSPGNPPVPNVGGDWQHDVYYAWLTAGVAQDVPVIEPHVLVARPEAQEPPSTAINSRGVILMTTEDGNGGINQHAGLWNSSLRAVRNFPFTIRRGGHSGHVAAMGERFLVTYGEGWVERGGFLDRGTGQDIYARIVEDDGTLRAEVNIAAGHRDGWPLVVASAHNWLVVWQRYPQMTLHAALIDAAGKVQKRWEVSGGMPVRYAYDVEYSPQLQCYVIAGSSGDDGFVALYSTSGDLVKMKRGLPPLASESRLILGDDGAKPVGIYPIRPRGVAVVSLSQGEIELVRRIDHPYAWDYMGTTGALVAPGRVLFATLSTAGLRLIAVNLRD